jgi:hypothetical protein
MPIAKHKIRPCLRFDTQAEEATMFMGDIRSGPRGRRPSHGRGDRKSPGQHLRSMHHDLC